MSRAFVVLLLAASIVSSGCLSKRPAEGLSSAELQERLTTKCREAQPEAGPPEISRCVADAAQTYARGLETFEQQYPLAPARTQCGATTATDGSIRINCQ